MGMACMDRVRGISPTGDAAKPGFSGFIIKVGILELLEATALKGV